MPTNLKQMRKEARRSAPPLKSTIFRPPRLMREKESSIVSVEFIADGLADVEAPFDPCQLDVPLPLPLQARVAALSIRPSPSSFANFAVGPDGTANQSPYDSCRDCYLRNKKSSREQRRALERRSSGIGRASLRAPLPPAARHREKPESHQQQWPTPTRGCVGRPQATPITHGWRSRCP